MWEVAVTIKTNWTLKVMVEALTDPLPEASSHRAKTNLLSQAGISYRELEWIQIRNVIVVLRVWHTGNKLPVRATCCCFWQQVATCCCIWQQVAASGNSGVAWPLHALKV